MEIVMTDDTAQGIFWELNYILRPDWTITNQEGEFHVGPPCGTELTDDSESKLSIEVWRISSFVAYRYFSSITKVSSGFLLQSMRENGTGFRIKFDLVPNGLPNHRPKPSID